MLGSLHTVSDKVSLVTGFTILQLKIPCVAGGIVYLYAWEFWLRSRHLIKNEHQRRQKITKHLVPILCGLATPTPQCALWQSCQLCKLSLKSPSWYNFFHWVSESFFLIFAWNLCLENNGLLFIHVQWNLQCYIIFFIVEPQFKAINFGGVNLWCWVKFMVVFPINFYKSCWSEFVRATKSVFYDCYVQGMNFTLYQLKLEIWKVWGP